MTNRGFFTVRSLNFLRNLFCLANLVFLLCPPPGAAPCVFAQDTAKTHRKILVTKEPDYPFVLRNGHFEGQVRLEATVLPNGTVTKVECKGGNPMLAQYASQAVMHWKYAPGPAQTVEEAVFTFYANK